MFKNADTVSAEIINQRKKWEKAQKECNNNHNQPTEAAFLK